MKRPLICVVDDAPDNRALMTAVLERAGLSVVAVEDGEALDEVLAMGRAPDLFILDLALPGESGTAILQRLRADPRWRGTPTLACTAHAMVGDAERGLAEGFNAYLTKPIDITTLVRVVTELLGPRGESPPSG